MRQFIRFVRAYTDQLIINGSFVSNVVQVNFLLFQCVEMFASITKLNLDFD